MTAINDTEPDAVESTTQQRVDIGELLIAMKHAIEKMGKRNTHRGILVTAGSVLIHLIAENQLLQSKLTEAFDDAVKQEARIRKPLVSLTDSPESSLL